MNRLLLRLKFVLLLPVALAYAVLPKRTRNEVGSVAIIQMAKLGDMVCTTPMFRAVKEHHPHVKLTVIGNAMNQEVLNGNPHIDRYHVHDGTFWGTVRSFRAMRFDAVCITAPSFEFLAICVIARVPLIIVPRIENGWSPYETRPYKILRECITTVPHRMESYAPREYLRLLEPLGIHTDDTRKEVYYPEAALERPTQLLNQHENSIERRRIGILPGAGNEIKSWQPEKFASLMNLIDREEPNTIFVLLGTQKDSGRAEIILRMLLSNVDTIDCVGKLSINELKACISMLSVVIGADTGPQYIAEALGIPTIDIVGPVDEREQPPTGSLHRIVKAERTKPELYVMNARVYDEKEARRQIESITPEMVKREYDTLKVNISNH
jgi:ADP-heptose:LPS heptosyltransferase